jgi:UDP-glucuronate decarboxylase
MFRFLGRVGGARRLAAPVAAGLAAVPLLQDRQQLQLRPWNQDKQGLMKPTQVVHCGSGDMAPPRKNGDLPAFRRVLVTGGAGFLGSHVCRRLLAEGHEVICLDNYFTSQRSNISDLMVHPRFELVRHDVTEPFYCECDYIFNMACPASPVHYQFNPIKTTKVSVFGTMNMLGLAKRVKGRMLQASTSEVYGDPEHSPQNEEYWGHVNTIGVRSCYDEGKRVAETLCFDYLRSNNVDIRVVRIFNTYGPGMHPYDGRVVTNFIMQALSNEDITIYGDGSQTRSFTYVDDTVEGILRLMDQDQTVGPINVGNPNEFTVKELAEMVIELTGASSKIIYLPLPGDDPKQRCPDISRARKYLDWEPKTQLREGLGHTIAYFKSLDLRKFKKPTAHTAHLTSEKDKERTATK